jgi:hypothetical protein
MEQREGIAQRNVIALVPKPNIAAGLAAFRDQESLRLDVRRLDDRPPLIDLGLLLRGERLSPQLFRRYCVKGCLSSGGCCDLLAG